MMWLENVVSMPNESLEYYSTLTKANPSLISASNSGWVARRRHFFIHGPRGAVTDLPPERLYLPTNSQWKPGNVLEL